MGCSRGLEDTWGVGDYIDTMCVVGDYSDVCGGGLRHMGYGGGLEAHRVLAHGVW